MSGFYDSSGNMQQLQLGSFGGSHGSAPPSFGGNFNDYYGMFANAPVGQGFGSIEKGLEAGTLFDMGGGNYGIPGAQGPPTSHGFMSNPRNSPMNIYSAGHLNNEFNKNKGRMQLGAALMADYHNMVAAGQAQGQRVNNALGRMDQAFTGGAANIRQSGQDAFGELTARGDQFNQQGQQFLADQTDFNKGVLAESDRLMKQGIDNFEKTTASDASAMKFGMARQRGQQRNQLQAAAKMGDPSASAALNQMDFDTAQQTQASMSQIASQFNQAKASMEMNRAQNYGQVGMQAGSNINQAGGVMANLAGMSKDLYAQGSAIKQGAEVLANQFYAQGQTAIADRIIANPGSPLSMASVISAMLAFDASPGSELLTGMPSQFLGSEFA